MIFAAAESDWPELLELWVEVWKATGIEVDFDSRRGWFLKHLRALTEAGYMICASRDVGPPAPPSRPEKAAGHAAAARADREVRDPGMIDGFVAFQPATGHIDQIAVAVAAQGSGAGTHLLDHAKTRCPQGLKLDVNQNNPRAVRFYLREGFVVTGESVSARSGLRLFDMAWTPQR